MPCRECAQHLKRLADIADAFGADPDDQRELCVRARAAGAKLEVLERRVRALETWIAGRGHPQRCHWNPHGFVCVCGLTKLLPCEPYSEAFTPPATKPQESPDG